MTGGARRVLAIGLDACSWPLVERLGAAGRVPALTRFASLAGVAEVRGASAYRAELSWTTFLSGRTPQENRYWGTVAYDPATYATRELGALAVEPFYARLGVDVVAVDVPHAVPWPGVAGAQVVAWGAHSPQHRPACDPPGLLDDLLERIGPHPAFDADSEPGWHSGRYQEELCAALALGAQRRADLVVGLLERVPGWRLALTVFSEPHAAGHHLWHGVDPAHPAAALPGAGAAGRRLAGVYDAVDRAIGRLLDAAGPDTIVVVFSVHDTVANANDLPALYLVPELLHRDAHGWGRLRAAGGPAQATLGAVPPAVVLPPPDEAIGTAVERAHRSHRGPGPSPPDAVDRLRDVVRRHRPRRPLPPWRQLTAPAAEVRTAPGEPPEATDPGATDPAGATDGRPLDYLGTARYQRFWPSQALFALPTFSDTHLRVNVVGREGRGVVPPERYGALLDAWTVRLEALRDGRDGRPAVAEVRRTRPGAPGDPFAAGPPADLVVRFARPTDLLEDRDQGRLGPLPFLRTGEHGPTGFVRVRDPRGPVRLGQRLDPGALGGLLRDLLGDLPAAR